MTTFAELQVAPSDETLGRLADALAPGGRIDTVERLAGGLDAGMHAFLLSTPAGEERRLVLRRYVARGTQDQGEAVRRDYQTLGALEALGVSAPRPVLLDADGAISGRPALVMTRLEGAPRLAPPVLDGWVDELAGALARLHRAPISGVDLSFLEGPEARLNRMLTWAARHVRDVGEGGTPHPDGPALLEALQRWRPRLRTMRPALTHGDYWAGNTLWQGDRLTAIIDWDGAAVGYPGMDVGYARMDLAITAGGEAPALFLRAYERAAGGAVPQLAVWDLLGAARALPDPARWLPGYLDLEGTGLTAAIARERLRAFIADGLRRAG